MFKRRTPAYRLPRTLRRARANAIDPNLKRMNEEYSAGSVAGKFRVLRWMPDGRYPFQRTCEFQTKTDFCSTTVNPKIEVPKFDKKAFRSEPSRGGAAYGGLGKTTAASLTALTSGRARRRLSNVQHVRVVSSKSSTCFPVSHAHQAMRAKAHAICSSRMCTTT